MKKLYTLTSALLFVFAANAASESDGLIAHQRSFQLQSVSKTVKTVALDMSDEYKTALKQVSSTTVDINTTAIDIAGVAAQYAEPIATFKNPFFGSDAEEMHIAFEIYNYDHAHVLGCLFSFLNDNGRMYFTNGGYLGYNAYDNFFDANLNNYALDVDFLGDSACTWHQVYIDLYTDGFEVWVDDVLAYDQNGGNNVHLSFNEGQTAESFPYNNMLDLMKSVETVVFGAGSWWSDNINEETGDFWDKQFSYIANMVFTEGGIKTGVDTKLVFGEGAAIDPVDPIDPVTPVEPVDPTEPETAVAESEVSVDVVSVDYYNIMGINCGSDFEALNTGIYVKKSTLSNGKVKTEKITKVRNY